MSIVDNILYSEKKYVNKYGKRAQKFKKKDNSMLGAATDSMKLGIGLSVGASVLNSMPGDPALKTTVAGSYGAAAGILGAGNLLNITKNMFGESKSKKKKK